MYTSLEIKGFRCFKHLTIPKLARLNLIGGKNNTGKTALLEALGLHASAVIAPNPIVLNYYFLRRLGRAEIGALGFRDLFGGFPDRGAATVSLGLSGSPDDRVLLSCDAADRTSRSLGDRASTASTTPSYSPIRDRPDRKLSIGAGNAQAWITVSADGIDMDAQGSPGLARPPCYSVDAGRRIDTTFLADRFSDLRQRQREAPLVALLARVEPRLLAVEVDSRGGQPVLSANLGEDGRMLLSLLGEGMHGLCAILLGLQYVVHGLLLVDEIENGLHYSVMPDVWRAIAEAATELDVQVFATTHSHECVEAAYEATEGMPEDTFLFHRLSRVGDEIRSTTYERDMLEAAFETHLEVR